MILTRNFLNSVVYLSYNIFQMLAFINLKWISNKLLLKEISMKISDTFFLDGYDFLTWFTEDHYWLILILEDQTGIIHNVHTPL